MALDARIPLLGQTPDFSQIPQNILQTAAGINQYRQQQAEAPIRQALLQNQVDQIPLQQQQQQAALDLQKAQLESLKETDAFKSTVYGALQGKQLLDAGDVNGFLALADDRSKNIAARGGNDEATAQIAQLVREGRIDEAKQRLANGVQMGVQAGILKADGRPETSTSFNDAKALLAARGITPGSPGYAKELEGALNTIQRAGQADPNVLTANQSAQLALDRERLDFEKTKTPEGGRPPAGYRYLPDGGLEPIPGGPADPKQGQKNSVPTEDERKAAGWYSQATNAYNNMVAAIKENPNAAKPGLIESAPLPEALRNTSRSATRQKYSQAASSFAEAALRAATGAGVTKDEANQKIRELTPQLGDSNDVVAQKQASLQVYLDSLKMRAGRAVDPNAQPVAAQSAANQPTAGGIPEGATATNPQTGQKIVFRGGQWQSQ